MRIGIEQKLGPGCPGNFDDMAVSQAMSLTGADLQEYACSSSKHSFFGSQEPGMSQYIDMLGLYGGQVGTGLYGLHQGFTVYHNYLGSKVFGMSSRISYGAGWHMGQFNSRNGDNVPVTTGNGAVFTDLMNYPLKRAQAHVISDGDGFVAILNRSPDEFDRSKISVT